MYKGSQGKVASLTEAMASSQAFIGVITKNYVADIRRGDTRIIKELKACKEFNVNCILIFFDDLTPEDRKFAENYFKQFHVYRTFEAPRETFDNWLLNHSDEVINTIKEASGS